MDDCPSDPTNSDPDCLDDLVDCPEIVSAIVSSISGSAITDLALRGGTMPLTMGVGGLTVTTTVSVVATAGTIAVSLYTLYCVIAALEG